MIKAAEAFKLSKDNDFSTKQLEEIEECIRVAARNGMYSCVYGGELTPDASEALIKADYRIEDQMVGGKYYTSISWWL